MFLRHSKMSVSVMEKLLSSFNCFFHYRPCPKSALSLWFVKFYYQKNWQKLPTGLFGGFWFNYVSCCPEGTVCFDILLFWQHPIGISNFQTGYVSLPSKIFVCKSEIWFLYLVTLRLIWLQCWRGLYLVVLTFNFFCLFCTGGLVLSISICFQGSKGANLLTVSTSLLSNSFR